MPKLFTLPSAAVLAVVGIGAGIHLGNGAANSINPFYYSPLPSRSYTTLSPSGGQRPMALSAAETRSALGGCVGCRTYPEEYVPGPSLVEQQEMPDGYYAASLGAPRGYRAAYVSYSEPAAEPDPAMADIERYASYPVTHAERDLGEIEQRAAIAADRAVAAREQADALRTAEENAAQRGTEQLIY